MLDRALLKTYFARNLRALLKKNKVSQRGLSERMGVCRQTISNWCNEDNPIVPNAYEIYMITDLFSVNPGNLFTDAPELNQAPTTSKIKSGLRWIRLDGPVKGESFIYRTEVRGRFVEIMGSKRTPGTNLLWRSMMYYYKDESFESLKAAKEYAEKDIRGGSA